VAVPNSDFPKAGQKSLFELSEFLIQGRLSAEQVRDCRKTFGDAPVSAIKNAIRDFQHMSFYWWNRTGGGPAALVTEIKRLPELGWLLMFHGNGHVREASLRALDQPPQTAFEFAAIVARMNDWVPQVRAATRRFAETAFPRCDAKIVAESAAYLLPRLGTLQRWDADTRNALDARLYQQDVLDALCAHILVENVGPNGALLRQLLRRGEFDAHLEQLVRHAKMPIIRAIAAEAVMRGKVRWVAGSARKWIDKPAGLWRKVPVIEQRGITVPFDAAALCRTAAQDKSPVVRLGIARALSDAWRTGGAFEDEIAALLIVDKKPNVRFHAEFYLLKRSEGGIS